MAVGTVSMLTGWRLRALRLAYAALPGPRIDEGVRRLGDVVREALKHRRRPSVKATAGALPVV